MAFATADLMCLFSAGAFNLWRYKSTGDTLATIDSAGYFNNAYPMFNVGDFIFIQASNGYGVTVVSAAGSGAVDTNDVAAINTDTD